MRPLSFGSEVRNWFTFCSRRMNRRWQEIRHLHWQTILTDTYALRNHTRRKRWRGKTTVPEEQGPPSLHSVQTLCVSCSNREIISRRRMCVLKQNYCLHPEAEDFPKTARPWVCTSRLFKHTKLQSFNPYRTLFHTAQNTLLIWDSFLKR